MAMNVSVCYKGHPVTQTVWSKNTTAAAFREGSGMWQLKSLTVVNKYKMQSVFLSWMGYDTSHEGG